MAMNIGSNNAGDQFYRYKMPPLQAKIEGRGNGIKTNIVNMVDIAKCLGRPASYTTKYFGCELGAQSTYNNESGLAIVNGAHDGRKLQDMLDGFIQKFVQCGKCRNPETVLEITKQGTILKNCKACGAVTNVDMRHKLTTFILKNPPPKVKKNDKYKDKEKEELARKAEKKAAKAAKKAAEEEGLTDEEKKALKEQRKKDREAKKMAKAAKRASKGNGAEDAGSEDDEDDDDDVTWQTDTSEAAAQKRAAQQLSGKIATMVVNDDDKEEEEEEEEEDEEEEVVERIKKFIASGKSPAEIVAVMKNIPTDDGAKGQIRILFKAMFDTDSALLSQMKAKLSILQKVVPPTKAVGQMSLMCCIEHYLAEKAPDQQKYTAHVVKFVYDEDIIDEEIIIKWADGYAAKAGSGLEVSAANAKAVRKAAAQVVEWLKTADEDEDEDDE